MCDMKLYVFEGTVDELNEVASNLGITSTATIAAVPAVPAEPEQAASSITDGEEAVSLIFARRVLKRREISEPMKAVLTTLYNAGDKMIGTSELCEVSNYTRPQFSGLMGAFGRRISHTEGYDSETYFFKAVWDEEKDELTYSLPDSVRDALVKENIV